MTLCLVKCNNGKHVYVAYQDLIWFNAPSDHQETVDVLSEVAKSFIGASIEGVVLDNYRGKLLIGRKQLFPHPFAYLKEHPELVFEGVVVSLNGRGAIILINWDKLINYITEGKERTAGFDRFAHLTGILPREDCSTLHWNSLKVGQNLYLKLGECNWENQDLRFVIASA